MFWSSGLYLENTWGVLRTALETPLPRPDDSLTSQAPRGESPAGTAPPAESALIEGCKSGRLSAFEELFVQHSPKMKSMALHLLSNTADAEDAVQETFLKVYRSVGSFKGQSSLATWMFRILINNCYDLRRRKMRRGGDAAELEIGAEGTPDLPAPKSDHPLRMALERAVAQLPSRQREVFLLAEVEGFKHLEIAGMLGISEANSKNILFQAKRSLREMLRAARA